MYFRKEIEAIAELASEEHPIKIAHWAIKNKKERLEEVFQFRSKTFKDLEDYLDYCVKDSIN